MKMMPDRVIFFPTDGEEKPVNNGSVLMRRLLPLMLVLAVFLLSVPGAVAYWDDYDGHDPVHQDMDLAAQQVYSFAELDTYMADVRYGARHEDLKDHIDDRYGIFGLFLTINHFWEADNGPDDPVDMVVVGDNGRNAWQKAQDLWAIALGQYARGDKPKAYEALGHVSHLLGDMGVPAHIHEDSHATDVYEDWMEYPTSQLSAAELASVVSQGRIQIPEGVSNPLFYLFYTTNQVTDWFPSDDDDGNGTATWEENGVNWMAEIYASNKGFDFQTPQNQVGYPHTAHVMDFEDCMTIRNYCYSYAIRAIASLYKLFEEVALSQSALTVVIDEVDAQDPHEDPSWGADFFAEVSINNDWFRNEGDQIIDYDHIYPHWAYGKSVGTSGQIPVCIQIWDEDEDPDDDDKSDIDPAEGAEDLDIVVDLATGAITGDVTGTCGATLTSAGVGDENDYSRIQFRILLPNIPPTAHAGTDQTVNEGDTVLLNGTYEDPNPEDTHTFLWHLKSSTNGQSIPDAATKSLTFMPNDNGVYTFTFTVTDNHGASGRDEVVVTANNVAPVARVDRLADETSAEIGTDVPVALIHLPVYFSGSFTDVGTADTHTAQIHWGDAASSSSFSTFTDSTGGVTGRLTQSHVYQQPGVLDITLNVTDDDGGVGSDTASITVVDAAGAIASAIEMLSVLPDNPKIQAAIGRLEGEKDSIAANGGLDMLDQDELLVAIQMIKQAIVYLDEAEAADPALDLTDVKGLLALAAKSITVGAIADAEAAATKANQLKKVEQAKALVVSGDQALAGGHHADAVGRYQEAVRAILGI